MAFERAKDVLGIGSRDKRYHKVEDDYQPPQDVENPHTTPDSGQMTLAEFMTKNRYPLMATGLLLIVGTVVLAVYAGRYFITAFTNPWFQRGLAGFTIAAAGYFWGRNTKASSLKNRDVFIAYNPDTGSVIRFLGKFKRTEEGRHQLFVPIKGYRWFGHKAVPYQIKDLSSELVSRYDRDPEDDVVIRTHPKVSATTATNTGRITTQLVAGLEPDPFGRESNVEATLPDIAARGTVMDLKDELEAVESELSKEEKRNNMLRRQRDDAISEAQKTREEIREEVNDVMEMVYPFARPGRRPSGNQANGHEEQNERVRQELTHDE